jgi:TldD protein
MLGANLIRKVLDAALSSGADFAEIFVEDSYSSELSLVDSKPSKAIVGRNYGAGLRLFFGHEQIYVTTNDLSESGLLRAAQTAARSRSISGGKVARPTTSGKKTAEFVQLPFDESHVYGTRPSSYDREKKFSYLAALDSAARARSTKVVQVEPRLIEKTQKILVANSLGVWAEDERNWVRIFMSTLLEDQGQKQEGYDATGTLGTSEFFEQVDFEKFAHRIVDRAELLIHADFAPAGEMPVIIDNGFGGVIFHEACGHGLETTSVAKNASVFCDKIGQKIAHESVTAVDDGTMVNKWGSLNVDDEGMKTKRTVLIENGILKSYIVDQMGGLQTGFERTGSGRRQNYKFAPASRMRNTFIAAGQDKLEDMIRDIDYGLYAKKMGGGSVSPGTGDYNFGVQEAYIIRNGKIEKPVKGATLIGRGIETLGRITRVADNLSLAEGMCGSVSGSIPTTVGQPALTVSSILVGGRAS